MRLYRLATLWLLVAACGDDLAPPDHGGPSSGACAGMTADRALTAGIYHGLIQLDGYDAAMSFRVDANRHALTVTVARETGDETVPLELDNGIGAHARWGDDQNGRGLGITGLDGDCTLRGDWRRCASGACHVFALTARRTDRLDEAPAHGLTLRGEFAGNAGDEWTQVGLAVNVRVVDHVAYLATYGDGLRIVDVHDAAHPVELGHLAAAERDGGEIFNDVKIADGDGHRYALMASNLRGVIVVDVTAPSAPVEVTEFGSAAPQRSTINVHTLFVDGGKAYLANIDTGLEIYDVHDPAHPARLGGWAHDPVPGADVFPHDLYVHGDRAYVDYWGAGMSIVDVSAAAPRLIGEFKGYGQTSSHSSWVTTIGGRTIAVHGDEQWDAHLHVVDVTEGTPAFATSIGEWRTRPEVSIHNLMAFGTRAFAAYYQDGVRVLDLADPAHPVVVAWFDTWPGYTPDTRYGTGFFEGAVGIDVDLVDHLIYVADAERGLIVLHLDV